MVTPGEAIGCEVVTTIVIGGVCGTGKTTVMDFLRRIVRGRQLILVEGDDYHPPGNIEKMKKGIPLTDKDREPWLFQLGQIIAQSTISYYSDCTHNRTPTLTVITCSALKRKYREQLRGMAEGVVFTMLVGSKPLLLDRLEKRALSQPGHCARADLLDSQLDILELPDGDEVGSIIIDLCHCPDGSSSAARLICWRLGLQTHFENLRLGLRS